MEVWHSSNLCGFEGRQEEGCLWPTVTPRNTICLSSIPASSCSHVDKRSPYLPLTQVQKLFVFWNMQKKKYMHHLVLHFLHPLDYRSCLSGWFSSPIGALWELVLGIRNTAACRLCGGGSWQFLGHSRWWKGWMGLPGLLFGKKNYKDALDYKL